MVVGEDCEVKHYLDSRATNVLYVEAGAFHVLIWKLSVTEDMVNMSRAHKSERAGVDFLFVSALFFIMMGVFYVTYLLLKSGYMCREEHICDEAFEDKLLDYRSLVDVGRHGNLYSSSKG